MKASYRLGLLALAIPLAAAGCGGGDGDKSTGIAKDQREERVAGSQSRRTAEADEAAANLAKLPVEDRRPAEAQRYCAVEDENLLGSMGPPVKVTVKGRPVFLCCKACQKRALAGPDKTLAKVQELKAKSQKPRE